MAGRSAPYSTSSPHKGAAEYELGAVGLFFSCGAPSLFRRVLEGYGYTPAQLDPTLGRRVLAYKLLHRYSNLRWYLERMPATPDERTLDALALKWWGIED